MTTFKSSIKGLPWGIISATLLAILLTIGGHQLLLQHPNPIAPEFYLGVAVPVNLFFFAYLATKEDKKS